MAQAVVRETPRERGAVLTLGFGTTAVMWVAGYVLRHPFVNAPGELVMAVILALLLAGGFFAGRLGAGSVRRGVAVGLLVSVLNMLILGGLLSGDTPGSVVPNAVVWLPGALLFGAVVGGIGAAAGAARAKRDPRPIAEGGFVAAFPVVAVLATLALVGIGGVVTSAEAGLAVPDWPNSYGYNMFMYPLARMTGGVYLEHAHRLFGALVGLTTLTLAGLVFATDRRRVLRGASIAAVGLVIVQGVLGGLRVTGRLTMSADPADLAPSTALAMVHGVTGQVFLALLTCIAVAMTPRWIRGPVTRPNRAAGLDRSLTALLVMSLLVQLVLGALYRHTGEGLLVHIVGATVVTAFVIAVGIRAWGIHGKGSGVSANTLAPLGISLLSLVVVQLVLGFAALGAIMMRPEGATPTGWEIVLATTHQLNGAVLLMGAVATAMWVRRFFAVPADADRNEPARESSVA